MADQTVRLEDNSAVRVALDLAMIIFAKEGHLKMERKELLTLYRQCYKAASGWGLEEILKEE